jgi:hypothetical protein
MARTEPAETEGDLLTRIAKALHEMCQPLTVLQCRLEIDLMESDLGTSVTQTAADCLRECDRLNASVANMRTLLQRAMMDERERLG